MSTPEERPDPGALIASFRARAKRLVGLAASYIEAEHWNDAKLALTEAAECIGKATSIAYETNTAVKDHDR
jgi:hypothetical protein